MVDKLDYSVKKLMGREYTSPDKRWFEEQPQVSFYLSSFHIWSGEIPLVPPQEDTPSIRVCNQIRLSHDVTVSGYRSWKAVDAVSGERLLGFVPPIYGNGYLARIFDGRFTEIPYTDRCGWFFDYASGILTFDSSPNLFGWSVRAIYLSAYLYIGPSETVRVAVWKDWVESKDQLPLINNSIGDIRPVKLDNNVGWTLYRCKEKSGPVDVQWEPLKISFSEIDGGTFV